MKGSRKIHQIQAHGDPLNPMVRDLACFCEYYLNEDWEFCVNVAHIEQWWLETLQPSNVTSAQNLNVVDEADVGQKLDFGSNGESLDATLKVDDNFVVPVEDGNHEKVKFYKMCCERLPFTLDVGVGLIFWDATYSAREVVVSWKY